VAHLHHAHAGALVVEHLIPDLLQDGLRHHCRASGKVINAVVLHRFFLLRVIGFSEQFQYSTFCQKKQQENQNLLSQFFCRCEKKRRQAKA
jgi:hypothetical protein